MRKIRKIISFVKEIKSLAVTDLFSNLSLWSYSSFNFLRDGVRERVSLKPEPQQSHSQSQNSAYTRGEELDEHLRFAEKTVSCL